MTNDMERTQAVGQDKAKSPERNDGFSVSDFIGNLDAGAYEARLDHAFRDVAISMRNMDSERAKKVKGNVTLSFNFSRIGESAQLMIEHDIKIAKPLARGKRVENDTTQTLMYVSPRGGLTIMPHNQGHFDFRKE